LDFGGERPGKGGCLQKNGKKIRKELIYIIFITIIYMVINSKERAEVLSFGMGY
jgi:hypothetical protein